jgi:hypothetical protein
MIKADNDAFDGRAHDRSLKHVFGGADLLLDVVELAFGLSQLRDGGFDHRRFQLGDLLVCTRDPLPDVGGAADELAQFSR